VTDLRHGGRSMENVPFDVAIASTCDCAVIATDYSVFDFKRIGSMRLLVDTRNAVKAPGPNVFRL
jgi:hypothetical protein